MSDKFRGNSPSQRKKVVTEDAKIANEKAKEAFMKRNKKKTGIMDQYGYHIVIGGFLVLIFAAFANTLFSKSRNPETTPVIEDDEIAAHNSSGYSYQLGSNEHFSQWMLSDAKTNIQTHIASRQNIDECSSSKSSSIIPDTYNFRVEFPDCVRSEVFSQDKCASSYATIAASTISDRYCRVNKQQIDLSPQPLIDCDEQSLKCKGGYISRSFDYAKSKGLPDTDCFNFTGAESSSCENLEQCKKYNIQDQCVVTKEEGIKREVFENGPVVVVLPLYRDFLVYKSGVYQVLQGVSPFNVGQAVKIVGWDKDESGRNYWIVENSWGSSWGENGLARIYIGVKELDMEKIAMAPVIKAPTEEAAN